MAVKVKKYDRKKSVKKHTRRDPSPKGKQRKKKK